MSEPLTPERLAELRRIAEAATPGPWAVNPFKATVDEMPSMLPICGLLWPTEKRTEEQTFANANYIAEFNPTTALAILDEIERLRREREEDDDTWTRYEELYVQARGQIVDLQLEIERLRREREVMEEVLKAVHERDRHIHTCDHCECALCPEGTELSYKAYIAQWIYSKGGGGA